MFTYYDLLKVERTATVDKIKKAYRLLVLKNHPDKLPPTISDAEREKAIWLTKEANSAWETLSNVASRNRYDAKVSGSGHSRKRKEPEGNQETPDAKRPRPQRPCEMSADERAGREQSKQGPTQSQGGNPARNSAPQAPNVKPFPVVHPQGNMIGFVLHDFQIQLKFSEKYRLVGQVEDKTVLKGKSLNLSFTLQKSKEYKPPANGRADRDILLTVLNTPSGKQVEQVSSLLKYAVKGDDTYQTLVLGVFAPNRKDSLKLVHDQHLAIDLDLNSKLGDGKLPSVIDYTATHQVFTATPPAEYLITQTKNVRDDATYANKCPQHMIKYLAEMTLAYFRELGDEVYKTVECGDKTWYRLAAVGARAITIEKKKKKKKEGYSERYKRKESEREGRRRNVDEEFRE